MGDFINGMVTTAFLYSALLYWFIPKIEEKIKQKNDKYKELQNESYKLKRKLTTYTNISKGKEYEMYISELFLKDGYSVLMNGILKGKKDKGIDLICTKENELILIQCKNWKENSKYRINQEKLKSFVGSCTEYVNEYKLFDKDIKLKFISSNYILDESSEKFLKESKTLVYEIINFND